MKTVYHIVQHPTENKFLECRDITNGFHQKDSFDVFAQGVKTYIKDPDLLKKWDAYKNWMHNNKRIMAPEKWDKNPDSAYQFDSIKELEQIQDDYQYIKNFNLIFKTLKEKSKDVKMPVTKGYTYLNDCSTLLEKLNCLTVKNENPYSNIHATWKFLVEAKDTLKFNKVDLYSHQSNTTGYVLYAFYNNQTEAGYLDPQKSMGSLNKAKVFATPDLATSFVYDKHRKTYTYPHYLIEVGIDFKKIVENRSEKKDIPEILKAAIASQQAKEIISENKVTTDADTIKKLEKTVSQLQTLLQEHHIEIPTDMDTSKVKKPKFL